MPNIADILLYEQLLSADFVHLLHTALEHLILILSIQLLEILVQTVEEVLFFGHLVLADLYSQGQETNMSLQSSSTIRLYVAFQGLGQ